MDTSTVFQIGTNIILVLVGGWAAMLKANTAALGTRCENIEKELTEVRVNYVHKADFKDEIHGLRELVQNGFDRLERKLDSKVDK